MAQLHPRCHVMNESDGMARRLFALQVGVLSRSRYCLETKWDSISTDLNQRGSDCDLNLSCQSVVCR